MYTYKIKTNFHKFIYDTCQTLMMIKPNFCNIKSFLLPCNKIRILAYILSLAFIQIIMSRGNIIEDGDKTLFLQQETSEISSPLNEFPPSTNVLVVDPNLSTLLDMKEIMERCAYQGKSLLLFFLFFFVFEKKTR